MPCGPRARLTAHVAYQTLTFAERDVLLAALADAGFIRVEIATVGTESDNPLPLSDSTGRIVGTAALVVHRNDLPFGFGDLGFVMLDGAYVPILPSDARAEPLLRNLRIAYVRAKAGQLAEQARRRYQGSLQRTTANDGSVIVRVRF